MWSTSRLCLLYQCSSGTIAEPKLVDREQLISSLPSALLPSMPPPHFTEITPYSRIAIARDLVHGQAVAGASNPSRECRLHGVACPYAPCKHRRVIGPERARGSEPAGREGGGEPVERSDSR